MDQLVAHTSDLSLGDLRLQHASPIRDALGSLPDDLDVADDRILSLAVRKERILAILRVARNRIDCLYRMQQIGTLVPQMATASA
jgi:hypothetical protein